MKRYLALFSLALLHTLVDTSALLVSPVWNDITSTCQLTGLGLWFVMLAQSLPTSLSQGVFGYLRDRRRLRWLIWTSPLLAAICLTAVGPVAGAGHSFAISMLFIVGGVAVGAFHPEAAVTAGQLLPNNRTRSLSIFMLGGSCGLTLGPLISGAVVRKWGLEGLIYLLPGFLVLVPLLAMGMRGKEQGDNSEITNLPRAGLREMFSGRIGLAGAVLAVCSLRLVPNMAMAKVVSFTLAARGFDTLEIGLVQSMFLGAASVGMGMMALFFPAGWERRFMIGCPMVGLPLLLVLGTGECPTWLFVATLVPSGFVLWGTAPAMVSYAQQLFPRGAGMASAITMGLAWGGGGLIESGITAYYREMQTPQRAFYAFLPFLAASVVGAWLLPQPVAEPSGNVERE